MPSHTSKSSKIMNTHFNVRKKFEVMMSKLSFSKVAQYAKVENLNALLYIGRGSTNGKNA